MNLSETIFAQLKTDIIQGSYPPGSKFPSERILAERLGVSRVTIRDAVRKLTQMGLVEKIPHSGTYVCEFESEASLELLVQIMQTREAVDPRLLESLLEFRNLAEVFAARQAASRITPQGAAMLNDIIGGIDDHLAEPAYLSSADYRLHFTVAHLSGNTIIRLLFTSFRPIYRFYTDIFYSLPDTAAQSMAFHRELVRAVIAGNSDLAANIMEQALAYARTRMTKALGF
ncbi:MAG: FadR/GntR family transcriptional regulator [Thermodesulfobacteriota bacterium]